MKSFFFTKRRINQIKMLIKTVSIIYKDKDTSSKFDMSSLYNDFGLNPYTLFKSVGSIERIEKKYPILYEVKDMLMNFRLDKDNYDLIEFKNNKNIREDILNNNLKVDRSKLNDSTTNILKKRVLDSLGYNTPSPQRIKVTPLVGTTFEHWSNNSVLSFCTDWKVSSFYLVLEANILIPAFFYIDNKYQSKPSSVKEIENYTIWLHKQLDMDRTHILNIIYGKIPGVGDSCRYIVDLSEENYMTREVFEDILYVLLNLILANSINKYIENVNLEKIDSENFFNDISVIVNDHYLKYKNEYRYILKLRNFAINNWMDFDSIKTMSNLNW